MLKFLNIINFAVIQDLRIDFREGLNLLTGETGSGKSIIVDALGLLLGGRSSPSQIRTGETTALIEGLFVLKGKNSIEAQRLLDVPMVGKAGSYELRIKRELSTASRNRITVNGNSVPISTLRALQQYLVEIHGQGEQRALLSTHSHLELMDQFANCTSLRRHVSEAYARWREAKEALTQLERDAAERERASDLLQYQLSEIEALAPKPLEDEALHAERKLLTHAETVLQLAAGTYQELYESEASILTRLAAVRKSVSELVKIDGRLAPAADALEGSMAALADLAETLRDYGTNLEFSPNRLAEIENRLVELESLKRKYNTDLQGVIEIFDELSVRLSGFSEVAEREPLLRSALQSTESEYRASARKLSHCRSLSKGKLERRVMSDLKHVAMENAQFIVALATLEPGASDNAGGDSPVQTADDVDATEDDLRRYFSPNGMDQVEFLLSANPGESPRPLAHVASGGELSRLMLTLRTIGGGFEEQQGVKTLIFDEVDVGIGGRVAEAVGQRLKALAATQQVLCVTHQPQIARFADHHYLVEKRVDKGRTQTIARKLSSEERVGELARMIGGDEKASTTRETARWLLENVGKSSARASRVKKSS